jgi:hypothetical protein
MVNVMEFIHSIVAFLSAEKDLPYKVLSLLPNILNKKIIFALAKRRLTAIVRR